MVLAKKLVCELNCTCHALTFEGAGCDHCRVTGSLAEGLSAPISHKVEVIEGTGLVASAGSH